MVSFAFTFVPLPPLPSFIKFSITCRWVIGCDCYLSLPFASLRGGYWVQNKTEWMGGFRRNIGLVLWLVFLKPAITEVKTEEPMQSHGQRNRGSELCFQTIKD